MEETAVVQDNHHPWCNYWGAGPAKDCIHCRRLKVLYPEDGLTDNELIKKYFPDAIVRE